MIGVQSGRDEKIPPPVAFDEIAAFVRAELTPDARLAGFAVKPRHAHGLAPRLYRESV